MKVVVKDANILIDFANGSLFACWFQLGYETWTTDLVLSQVQYEEQWNKVDPHVRSGALKVIIDQGALLPSKDCEILLEKWKG